MIAFPNAKINLGLNVRDKRADGFHNIETVFFPVQLFDALEIIRAGDGLLEFISTGLKIPGKPEDNLCLKAYELLKSDYHLPAVKIHLHKVIPMGAGLGGGSADAAYTLKLLNVLFELNINDRQLQKYASMIGADCSFFIENKAVAAHGKGDQFNEIKLNLEGYFLVLVVPEIHIATAKAYSKIKIEKPEQSPNEIIENYSIHKWKSILVNDFEVPIFQDHPVLSQIKAELYQKGAVYASMSGSGSAIFGLFENPVALSGHFKNYFYWSTKI